MENLEVNLKLIEQGILKGREALKFLQETGKYVFHGSPRRLGLLEPHQAYQFNSETKRKIPDGEPAVFASVYFEPAIFKGIIHHDLDSTQGNWSGWNGRNGKFTYKATKTLLEKARFQGRAYIYVFPRDDFELHNGSEYRSLKAAIPLLTVEVTGKDLPVDIEIVEPITSRL